MTALSDPTRRAILIRLSKGAASVNDIAEPFKLTQQAISKHLAYLEKAHLIEKKREGRQHFCSIRVEPLSEVTSWVEDCRRYWEASFNRLDKVLEVMKLEKRRGEK